MSKRISRRDLESSLEKLMTDGVTASNRAHQTFSSSKVRESEKQEDVTQCDVEALEKKEKCLSLKSSHVMQSQVVADEKDSITKDDNAQSIMEGNACESGTKSFSYGVNIVDIATQICNIFKTYNLNVTGMVTLPDGNRYDRIFNIGGGNCFFYSVCQGLDFFGISIDHVELRTKVGGWLQNRDNAHLMETDLELLPSGLYHHLKEFPSPQGGWESYLRGMTWQDWGVHVGLLGEWVGPMEITSTNHVLEEMGTDVRVNIFDPRSGQIFGDEENQHSDGMDKPIIIMSLTGLSVLFLPF